MGIFNSIMSDTVGVVVRAATGKPDPWTVQEINDTNAQDRLEASRPVGQTNPGVGPQTPDEQAIYDGYLQDNQETTTEIDNNQPVNYCSVTSSDFNLWKCITNNTPGWVPYAAIGVGVIVLLWIARPYVELLED